MNKRYYSILGHGIFIVAIVFAVVWVYARVLYIDSAYQILKIINTNCFAVNDGRYSMILPEILPLLCCRLNMPLPVVLTAYSLSYVILAYILYNLTLYLFKDFKTAFVMVLTFICMRNTFMHSISETFQLMFYSMFLYALISFKPNKNKSVYKCVHYIAILLFTALCVFIHPVAVFFLFFVLVYAFLENNNKIDDKIIIASISAIILVVLKFVLPSEGGRDATFLLPLPELFSKLPDILHSGSLRFFIQHFFDFYMLPSAMFIWTSIVYIKRHKLLKSIFYMGFNFCFFLITIWIYFEMDGPIAMERSFMPLMFFMAFPFVKEVLFESNIRIQKVLFVILALFLVNSMLRIALKAEKYDSRLERMDYVLKEARSQKINKVLVSKDLSEEMGIPYNWGSGIESILYTSAKYGADSVSNLYVYQDLEELKGSSDLYSKNCIGFLPWWNYLSTKDLNPKYFHFREESFYVLSKKDSQFFLTKVE